MGLGLELTFGQSNHEGNIHAATNITGVRRFVESRPASDPTRITPNEWASVLSLLLLAHFKVSR
jgi:hypothetical protein